nr:MAG TPA: hypothetical protein [Caudoviricetes sp.]
MNYTLEKQTKKWYHCYTNIRIVSLYERSK